MQPHDAERVEVIGAMFPSPRWVGTIWRQDGRGLRSNLNRRVVFEDFSAGRREKTLLKK
jgi:hypothetical protein